MRDLGTPLVAHQCSYNLLNRSIENGVMQQSAGRGMGMVVYSPLAQGLLSDRYLNGVPGDSRAASTSPFLNPEQLDARKLEMIRQLSELASERGQSLARLALQWCLRRSEVATVLIGASRVEQIEENLQILEDPTLSEEFCIRLDGILED